MPQLVALGSHQISAADGTRLHVADYLLPPGQARGSVVILHGLGEHCGRYQQLASVFNECGLSVRCFDHRGHGRSEGRRGDVINGDPMLQDAEIVIEDFTARYAEPPFLFGHSMGGLFAARYALSRLSPLRGLILSSPALALRLSPTEHRLLGVAEKLFPWLGLPNGLDANYLSHDADVVTAYRNDPLVHNKISARLLRSMLSSIAYCEAHAAQMTIPTLMLVAGDDHAVDPSGTLKFSAQLPPQLAQLRVYDRLYHEIFKESDASEVLDDLRAWLEVQTAA